MLNTVLIEDNADAAEKLIFLIGKYGADRVQLQGHASSGQQGIEMIASYKPDLIPVSYTHLRAHETVLDLVCRLLLEKKKHTHAISIIF